MTVECDPTNTDIVIEPAEPAVKKPNEPVAVDQDSKVIFTIDGPRPVTEICWGFRRLQILEDF